MFFIHTVMSSSLQPHELQHTRLPCRSLSPGICPNSCPFRQLCQESIISFSVIPIPTCLQSYPALGSFLMIWLFASGGQSNATSGSVLKMSSQCWFPSGLIGLISLHFKWLKSLLQHTVLKHRLFGIQPSLWFKTHIHAWLLGKTIPWLYGPLPAKLCLWFQMLSRFVIAFPPRSKCLLTSWLQSPCTVILELTKIKTCHCFHCVQIYLLSSDGTGWHGLSLLNVKI